MKYHTPILFDFCKYYCAFLSMAAILFYIIIFDMELTRSEYLLRKVQKS